MLNKALLVPKFGLLRYPLNNMANLAVLPQMKIEILTIIAMMII